MYCPKCGQQQVSEEMRFCSRCGFQLGAVNALLATGGASTDLTPTKVKGRKLLANRDTRRGAKLMFTSGVLLPVAMFLSFLFDSPGPLFLPLIVFMAGLAWLLYYRLFGEEPVSQTPQPAQLHTPQPSFLPASHDTAEIVPPPSVTEHTTRLLSEDK